MQTDRKYLAALIAVAFSVPALAEATTPAEPTPAEPPPAAAPAVGGGFARFLAGKGDVGVSVGYRHDDLDYNIGLNIPIPNIASELDWSLDMTEIRLDGNWITNKGLVFNAEASYAYASSGDNRDSDYYLTRDRELSRTKANSKGSWGTRFSLGVGGRFTPRSNIAITPLLGYAWQNLDLRNKDQKQQICVPNPLLHCPPAGTRFDTGSTYKPRWHGPWLGVQFDFSANEALAFKLSAKHNWFDYQADANWKGRTDLAHPVSFRHSGHSRGWRIEGGATWKFTERSTFELTLNLDKQNLDDGKVRRYLSDGSVKKQPLNEVNWGSWSALVGYRYSF